MMRKLILPVLMAAARSVGVGSASAATIEIPRIHLGARVTYSVDTGPAWWPIAGRPGGGTTVAIAGHRTTHSRPFASLQKLRRGDLVIVTTERGRFRYRVSGARVYPSTDMHIVDPRPHEVLILSTCTPPGSDRFRLVVYALPEGS